MDNETKSPRPPRKAWAALLAGIGLVAAASYLAHWAELGGKLELDFRGVRVTGQADPAEDGVRRISYHHPSGGIYATRYKGSLGLQRVGEKGEITVAYDPQHPTQFQPAGLSYLPGAVAGGLFLVGMWLVFRARRLLLAGTRRRT